MFLNITDPIKASYEVEDPEYSMVQLAQTSARAEVARLGVDTICQERESLGRAVMVRVNTACEPWGIVCARYEVRDIALPAAVHRALQMQVESERKKRAAVLGEDTQTQASLVSADSQCLLLAVLCRVRGHHAGRGERGGGQEAGEDPRIGGREAGAHQRGRGLGQGGGGRRGGQGLVHRDRGQGEM